MRVDKLKSIDEALALCKKTKDFRLSVKKFSNDKDILKLYTLWLDNSKCVLDCLNIINHLYVFDTDFICEIFNKVQTFKNANNYEIMICCYLSRFASLDERLLRLYFYWLDSLGSIGEQYILLAIHFVDDVKLRYELIDIWLFKANISYALKIIDRCCWFKFGSKSFYKKALLTALREANTPNDFAKIKQRIENLNKKMGFKFSKIYKICSQKSINADKLVYENYTLYYGLNHSRVYAHFWDFVYLIKGIKNGL